MVKVEKSRDGNDERTILTGMIVDRTILGRITSIWERGLFGNRWCTIVAEWCVEFFQKFDAPPLKAVEDKFHEWSATINDDALARIIGQFLADLSNEFDILAEEINAEHVIDLAGTYFNRVRLARLATEMDHDIATGQQQRAEERLQKHRHIDVGGPNSINVLQDQEVIRQAFDDSKSTLIEFPGAANRFFADAFAAGNFISIEAPEKRGKSFMLLDIVWRAVEQRRKVAFFDAGDMGQHRTIKRFACRASGIPLRTGIVKIPMRMMRTGNKYEDLPKIKSKRRRYRESLTWQKAWQAMTKVMETKVKSRKPYLKMQCHPTGTLKVSMIATAIEMWEQEGWQPHVVVIDYADILAPDVWSNDERDRINNVWMALRALSQAKRVLVVTASQTDANSYSGKPISMKNFSGDKRKRAHVDGTFAINQTVPSKAKGLSQLSWVAYRDEQPAPVWIAECRAFAHLCYRSI